MLACAYEIYHINKNKFSIPFVCGAKDLDKALRRISEGASMIRLKGNTGTGNMMHAVKYARKVFSEIRILHRTENIGKDELEFVETQIGSYLGEDDIIRYKDDFGRK